jgi:6-pyruvoyl-tetrahydropterin synthase
VKNENKNIAATFDHSLTVKKFDFLKQNITPKKNILECKILE